MFGFLGKNGARKTTTLKLILGLLKIQKEDVSIFGQTLSKNSISILKEIGSTLIESPSFYGHLSARDNLIILQKIYQCPKKRIHLNRLHLQKSFHSSSFKYLIWI